MTARRAGRLSLPFLVQRAEQHTRITATEQKPRPNQRPGIYEKGTEMTETTVNIPLLRKAVEWAEAEAAKPWELCEWNQGDWILPTEYTLAFGKSPNCGTCYCIAGYIAQVIDPRYGEVSWVGQVHASDAAALELGLSGQQANDLFDAGNTITRVREVAESIAGERL